MATYRIPLINSQQALTIMLGTIAYRLRVTWNAPGQAWLLDIADRDGVAIAQGIALTAGADLLGQLEYLGINGALVARVDSDVFTPPDRSNLGSGGSLYFISA